MHITAREIGIPDWVINLRHRLAHGPGEQNMTGLHEALKIVLKALIYNEKNYWNDQYILYQEEIEFSNRRKHYYSFIYGPYNMVNSQNGHAVAQWIVSFF